MRRTSIRTLALTLAAVAAVGWFVVRTLEGRGVYLPPVSWVVDVTLLALAGGVLWAGWAVRAYLRGDRPSLDPLRAARTFVLAKAAALTGALLGGWYLAQVLAVLGDLGIESLRARAVAAGVAVACSVVLSVVGLVVEKFCEIPPGDDGTTSEHDARASGPDGEAGASA